MNYVIATVVWLLFFYVLYQIGETFELTVMFYKP